jgi:tetratricopeptide (TPR) repeat protein
VACGLASDETLDAVEESLAARLLTEYPGDSDVFAFAHALIRNAVYVEIPPDRRRQLHERVGVALETTMLPGAGPSAADLARHFGEALPLGAPVKAAIYARRAGHEAVERFAFSEAVPWYEQALALGADAWNAGEQGRVQFSLARALEHAGSLERARDAYMAAADLARTAADGALLADIGVAATGPWNLALHLQPAVLALLDEALELIEPHDRRRQVQVLNSLAATLYYTDPEREGRVARRARELGEELGDTEAVAAGNLALHRWLTHTPEARQDRLELSGRTVAMTRSDDCRHLHLRAARLQLADFLQNAHVADFDRGLDKYEADASAFRSPPDIYWSMALRATQATLHGDLISAEQRARGAMTRGRELEQTDVVGAHVLHLFVIRYQQARLAELVTGLSSAAEPQQGYRAGMALAAVAGAETGRVREAGNIVRRAIGPDGQRLARDNFWLAAMALFAGAAAREGDPATLELLAGLLEPFADHVVVFGAGGAVLGCGHHWLGVLAGAQGETDRALDHLDTAAAMSERMDAPYWVAQASIDAALVLERSDQRDDRSLVESLTKAAVSVAQPAGYERVLQQAAPLNV